MKKYMGVNLVNAEPVTKNDVAGYGVLCKQGAFTITVFAPKEEFEKNYIEVGMENTITPKNVDDFIKTVDISTVGTKTTLVRATLVNGFEILESSSCVDPKNYDEKLGSEICLSKIKDKIWAYLGFMLQTGVNGVK